MNYLLKFHKVVMQQKLLIRRLHVTARCADLMEFFDKPENWGEKEVKCGRHWMTEELRNKSNEDLHKLWYVLLKERNMLLTMEYAAKQENEVFANPERIDRVEESMKNLESVVRERNAAFLELEYGFTGERPSRTFTEFTGFKTKEYLNEHVDPPESHPEKQKYEIPYLDDDAQMMQKLWKEQEHMKKRDDEDDAKRERKEHKFKYRY